MVLIAAVAVVGVVLFARQIASGMPWRPRVETVALGAVTNFFDTLGIGSFAPTMAWFRLRRLVPDRAIPPTMYVGHGLPAIAQSMIYLALLGAAVDPWLLVACVGGMLAGVALGAPLVARASLAAVRGGIAIALASAGVFYAATNLGMLPPGGTSAALPSVMIPVAVLAHIVMGVLVHYGIGHYAPSLLLFSLLGMDPHLIFPIMATVGVLGMSGVGLRYLASPAIDLRIAAGLTIGGIPAVLVAALLVRSMPVTALRWLVVAVVLYAALTLAHSALTGADAGSREAPFPTP
jgi:uncharacterized membrane protein YfcA